MSDVQTFAQGAASADPAYDPQECADVKAWLKRIEDAREFDKHARKQYAIDRRYARGDSGKFEVSVPIAGSYIDILKSILYAKNPDLDCQPSEATSPPPMSEVMDMAKQKVMADPKTAQMMEQVGMQAAQAAVQAANQASLIAPQTALGPAKEPVPAPPIPSPEDAGEAAAQAWLHETIKAQAKAIMKPYHDKQSQAKQLGSTLEIVVSRLWLKAKLKLQADPMIASCLTVGSGWLKVTWQQRTGQDPIVAAQIRDVQDQLARLTASQNELDENPADADALKASIEQQLAALEAKVEVVVARGLAIDFERAENIQVAPECGSLTNYLDSPWIAHRAFFPMDDAAASFPLITQEKLKKATTYYQDKPKDGSEFKDVGALSNVSATDADSYRLSSANGSSSGSICAWEVWNKADGSILTLIEGLDVYAKKPYPPDPATTRWYPFFSLSMLVVDGERHPQSLVFRTQSLLDDMNRIYSNRAEHRRRCIPKTGFNAGNLDPTEVKKIEGATTGEMIGLHPTNPETPIGNLLQPIHYPAMDQALYDDGPTRAALEIAWGIQEALASSIRTAKTATEAEIQQTGTNARTTHMRDAIDKVMDDLALYTAEVALQKMSHDDAVQIAGPWAFWPEGIKLDDLGLLVTVQIKGGSSGKPDTSAQQQVWATTFPILQNAVMTIGRLRGSSPEDIADCVAELVSETLIRQGDRLDPSRFLPPAPSTQAGPQPPLPAPQGATPPIMPGMQPPPPDPGVMPVPHAGHIYVNQNGAQH